MRARATVGLSSRGPQTKRPTTSAANATVNKVLRNICFLRNETSISRSIDCSPYEIERRQALSKRRASREKTGFQGLAGFFTHALCGGVQQAVRKRTAAAIYEILESVFKKMETGPLPNFALKLSTLGPPTFHGM